MEYEALGENFNNRGRRSEEQIALLRQLWTQPLVTFEGRWHKVTDAGLNPLPVNRPIPIWFGSESGDKALRRIARLADGWMSLGDPTPDLPRLRQFMHEAGRDPQKLMVRGPLVVGEGGTAAWIGAGKKLQAAGVTHINLVAPPDMAPLQALPRIIEARHALAAIASFERVVAAGADHRLHARGAAAAAEVERDRLEDRGDVTGEVGGLVLDDGDALLEEVPRDERDVGWHAVDLDDGGGQLRRG